MAQERWWNWLDDDSTFRMNWRDLVIIPFGLYAGFDKKDNTGMVLTLTHTIDNKTKVKKDLTTSAPFGIWKSKQGTIIAEDEDITLNIATGSPNADRIDLIVGEHEYVEAEGGAFASYKVIQGTPSANPQVPELTEPNKQVILGRLIVPAGTNDLNNATWIKADKPDVFGDDTIMHTDRVQESTSLKIFNVQRGIMVLSTVENGKINTDIHSNFYNLNVPNTGAKYTLVTSLTKPFTGSGQIAWFYTNRGLKFNHTLQGVVYGADGSTDNLIGDGQGTLQGNINFQENISFVIPESTQYVEPNSVFGLMDISGIGSLNRTYVLVDANQISRTRKQNKFHGMVAQNSGTAIINNENYGIGNSGGNFFTLNVGGTITSMDSVMKSAHNPNTTMSLESGTVIYIHLRNSMNFKHNTPSNVENSKPLWIPTEESVSLDAGTTVMFIEDRTHWRMLSVWNKDLSVLTLALPIRLEDLSNVDTTTFQGNTIEHHIIRATDDGNWESVNLKNWIQTMNLKMSPTFEQGARVFNNLQFPNTPFSLVSGNVYRLGLTSAMGNLLVFNYNVNSDKNVGFLPSSFQVGTVLETVFTNGTFKFIMEGGGVATPPSYLPLRRVVTGSGEVFTPKPLNPVRLIRLPEYWLIDDSNPKENEIPAGFIGMWSGRVDDIPNGWLLCDGTNNTPNLKGRFIVGFDSGKADYNVVGKTGGLESVTLTTQQIPNHYHFTVGGTYSNDGSGAGVSANNTVSVRGDNQGDGHRYQLHGVNATAHAGKTNSVGGGQPHENRPPYYVMAFIMKAY